MDEITALNVDDDKITVRSHVRTQPHPQGLKTGPNVARLHAKRPSSLARRLKLAGVDWVQDFALAIKTNNRERINVWLRLVPYLVTTVSHTRAKRFKGKASKAAVAALEALEGR